MSVQEDGDKYEYKDESENDIEGNPLLNFCRILELIEAADDKESELASNEQERAAAVILLVDELVQEHPELQGQLQVFRRSAESFLITQPPS